MARFPLTRIPQPMYDYLKKKAVKKQTSMRIEADRMFDRYKRMSIDMAKLKGKKVFVIK
jgi:hypothetical protein